jgi:hypothetical protein
MWTSRAGGLESRERQSISLPISTSLSIHFSEHLRLSGHPRLSHWLIPLGAGIHKPQRRRSRNEQSNCAV